MRRIELASGVALAASIALGGATQKGVVSDDLVQLICLPILGCIILEYGSLNESRASTLFGLTILAAVPLLQLIPLPPAIWTALPGHATIVATYHSAGLDLPWGSLSISPWATTRSACALIPPVTIFLGVQICGSHERRRLALLVVAFGVATVVLEIMQLVQGQDSALRFYAVTFQDVGVGFSANRNHTAAFLSATIPIAAFAFDRSIRHRTHGVVLLLLYWLTAWLGLMMTASRSALLLGFVATIGSVALSMRGRVAALKQFRTLDYFVGGACLFGAGVLASSFGLSDILARLGDEKIAADARWPVAKASIAAAEAFFPFGSGLGTFDRVYPMFEGAAGIVPAFVNHAHNDLLELVVETGVFGLLILVGMCIFAAPRAWRRLRESEAIIAAEQSAALLVMALVTIHSLWDYPLRASGVAGVFSFCGAMLCAIPRVDRGEEVGGGGRGGAEGHPRRRAFAASPSTSLS